MDNRHDGIDDHSRAKNNPITIIMRWLLLIPCAVISSLIAHRVVCALNLYFLGNNFVDPKSLLGQLWILFIGNFSFGSALVFVGAYIAPAQKKIVVLVLSSAWVSISGSVMLMNLLASDYMSVAGILSSWVGAIGVSVSVYTGELFHDDVICNESKSIESNANMPPSSDVEALPDDILLKRAQDAPCLIEEFMNSAENQLLQEFPAISSLTKWGDFHRVSTIAGCVLFAIRLHFDVPISKRVLLETQVRNALHALIPNCALDYERCRITVGSELNALIRKSKTVSLSTLTGSWVIEKISDGKKISSDKHILSRLSAVYERASQGYWK